jgi:L-seryl-tRNA(Ser) seleniumtransferase
MLMAVEMWFRRDHDAEWKQWQAWLDHIARRVSAIDGVTTSVSQPEGLSNRMPSLQIRWDRERLGTSGEAVARLLFETAPRVSLFPARGKLAPSETGLSIGPYMMAPGDEQVVAEHLYAVLKNPPRTEVKPHAPPAADITGSWTVRIEYAASSSTHTLHLRQRGNTIDGMHQGDFVTREAKGTIDGDRVRIRSEQAESHGDALGFTFSGQLEGDVMSGELDMGEYLKASWSATRPPERKA